MAELRTNDLYANGFIESYPNGEQYLERNPIDYEGDVNDEYHTVKETDTITYLAWFYYRKYVTDPSKYWGFITDVNEIENPMDLTELIGQEITIPNIQKILINE